MTEETKPKRPKLVWVISIFYLLSAIFVIILLFYMINGKITVTEELRPKIERLSTRHHVSMTVFAFIDILGAIFLFLLRRVAFKLFVAGLSLGIIMWIIDLGSHTWGKTIGWSDLIYVFIGWTVSGLICFYVWKLQKRGVLT